MKKKTVITTEKREVWVIRQASGETEEQENVSQEAETADSLTMLPDHLESDVSPNEQPD
jgi:hypothetical protein